ncbi:hypothetical protein PENSPDRAFT_695309 [Peniophora sp. CONT]|nr:hypothetical protein PENSPDRAFT_695309 [Peniophora sp. CONT]
MVSKLTTTALWSLAPGATILPPPVGAITTFRIWVYPGCIMYLADDTRIEKKRGAVFVGDDPHSRCVCVACAQEYLPLGHTMAYCSACSDAPGSPMAWYHESCAQTAPTPARLSNLCAVLNIGQREEDVEAPAIRRAPSQGPSVWLPAPRGIRVRVDCPVRSWERISLAFRRATREQGSYESQEEFLMTVAPLAAQSEQGPFQRQMPEAEVLRALELDTDDVDGFRLLRCPTCRAVM